MSSFIFILIALLGVDAGENQFSVEKTPEGALVCFKPPSGEFGCGTIRKRLFN